MDRLTRKYFDDMQGIERYTAESPNIEINCGGDDYQEIIDKLAEYENAEKDGRLLELPCKVGDILYKPTRNFVSKYRVVFLEVSTCNNIFLHTRVIEGINDTGEIFGGDRIGKTVFLTPEAAEAALKEMEGRE